ncbi:glutamate racemase [Psychromonas ossibalaenae]|uniref:glutamate racemase n=1 Tax=Psychromonas ossibalaenae TaxID=444922 RepID=UPI000368972B|nr:glutamate racemase [Psychromonas ossibalaenae]
MSVKQVLIFDSGVGGLSVFAQVLKVNPNISYSYLFDNAYFPYGELDHDFLIQRITRLLVSFSEKQPVDLIVIACNSASTAALQALRARFSIPIVGVVPAIKPAAGMTKNGVIGLLATPATVNRTYTQELITQFAVSAQVLKIGSTELVKLAEQKLQGATVDKKQLQIILQPWLSLKEKPDTLVLGCTHFPLLKKEIAACFDNEVNLVDSGKAIAKRVNQLLGHNRAFDAISQHQAYYTKSFSSSKQHTALQSSFRNYGFTALKFYPQG